MTEAELIANVLLEMDEFGHAGTPATVKDLLHRRYRELERSQRYFGHENPVKNLMFWLNHGHDASYRSFEGEPPKYKQPYKYDFRPSSINSKTMSMNRNLRRKSFGYKDTYSMRERGWPTGQPREKKHGEPELNPEI